MKENKFAIFGLCAIMLFFSACSSMNNTTKGGLFGAAGGALVGGLIGKAAGNTVVGAAIGTAVGSGAGILIGKKMDKAKAEAAAAVKDAKVETMQDKNGLTAVKVTFDCGILFNTNKYDLSTSSEASLAKFAEVLKKYQDIDVAIYGHTDSTGSDVINNPLSLNRAESVERFLSSCGVNTSQFKSVEGRGSKEPIASNATKLGRTQNRRVEVFMYASQDMISKAQNGTLETN